jgi:hypothetical protein
MVNAGIRQVDLADCRRIPSLVLQGLIFSEIRLYPPHGFGLPIAISQSEITTLGRKKPGKEKTPCHTEILFARGRMLSSAPV